MSLKQVYQKLFKVYGPQHWWPADSPFEVMIGAILTQNTAWTNVEKAIHNLKENSALDPEVIVSTHQQRLASWLKPSGYFNIKAKRLKNYCQWYLAQGGYQALNKQATNDLRHALLSVNGIGPETADDILLYAFQRPVFVIDAYTRRIFSRLGLLDAEQGYEHLRQYFENNLQQEQDRVALFNEYHAMIVDHAKDVCRKKPFCQTCCLLKICPYGQEQ